MATRKKSHLVAQGKERRLDGTGWPWRVRLYAPPPGGTSFQIKFKAPAGEGEPWKPVLRRANTEAEARQIFAQAEAALDAELEAPAKKAVRTSRTIRALGEAYLADSLRRGKQPRTLEQRESKLNAHILPRHRISPRLEVAGRAQPRGHGEGREDDPLHPRPRGPARPARGDAQARLASRLARSDDRPSGRTRHRSTDGPAGHHHAVRRPAPPPGDPPGVCARWPTPQTSCAGRRPPTP